MPGKRKPIAERRSHPFQIRLTEAEFLALDARAESEGVNLADMIRAALGLATAATDSLEFDAKVCPVCGQLMAKGQTLHAACK